MRSRIAPLTAAGVLALAAVNPWLLTIVTLNGETQENEPVPGVAPYLNVTEATGGLIATRSTAAYRETLARPVFYKTRQPFVPPPPTPPPATPNTAALPAPADPGIALGGVAINSDLKKVYLFSKANSLGAWVRHARLDHLSFFLVRRLWNAAQLWPGQQVRRHGNRLVDGQTRAHGTHG